tara:strand:+ start:443 stop:664 length:222 start_codon:yes stop_codon:yes gene_type:complete
MEEILINWHAARAVLYPTLTEQADAAYWARKGDTSLQEAIDAKIAEVKLLVPKTWATRTSDEFEAWVESLETN